MIGSTRPRALRRQFGALLVDGFFTGTARAGKWVPLADPARHGVEVTRDVPYLDTGLPEHRLDIYRPAGARGPLPVVLYVHGGGFRILSKDSHWLFGLLFARRGYLVFNISYRLAPAHPYPAAHQDAFAAYQWVAQHAAEHGGDLSRLVLAGESAGGNLVTSLAVASAFERPEPWARAVFDTGVVAKAVVPACGILQVSAPERFQKPNQGRFRRFIQDRLDEVSDAYLGAQEGCELADPLCILEGAGPPRRPLPPFFAPCGTWDVLIDDTRRLEAALTRLGAHCETAYYPRGLHAFHAMVFRAQARKCWRDTFDFLERQGLRPGSGTR